MAAAFQSIGVDARPSPPGDAQTYELARPYLSGDECLPEAVTLGNFIKVTLQPDYDPAKTAFLLPTSNGPCRFGHYLPLARKIFKERGEDVLFISMSSSDGYKDIGAGAGELVRTGWRAVVAADILRKLLLKTRPYETVAGSTDRLFEYALDHVCAAIAVPAVSHRRRMKGIVASLRDVRAEFTRIEQDRRHKRPLIGVVGEIFCRLNDFSNDQLLRMIEKHGGEAWISDVSEWVWYTSYEERQRLLRYNNRYSFSMLSNRVREAYMHADEKKMLEPFTREFAGYEEPEFIDSVLQYSEKYLPGGRAKGEMVLSVGKAIWYHKKGAAGVIDISPFSCMNGIVCEAVYPRVSADLGQFPMRVLYFDGLMSTVEDDVEIFMELARNYGGD
jgi:predicted nucleotide-binding protein (sugar kinase/HSP70/actin superfamily)